MVDPINQLGKLAIIQIDFDIWSGQVKLDDPDIKLGDGGKIPPKQLVELGRKNVINRKHLNPFSALKTQARRLLGSHGIPFMNGFAVPLTVVDEVTIALDDIGLKMDELINEFIHHYDKWVDDWVDANPEYSNIIRAGALSKEKVRSRLGFEYQIYQVQPVNEQESRKLNDKALTLSGKLLDEVVTEANDFFNNCINNRDSLHSNTHKTLKRIREKVNGLSFLDKRFNKIVEILDKSLAAYSQNSGRVVGAAFYKVLATTLILSSKDKIEMYANGSLTLESMASSLEGEKPADDNLELELKSVESSVEAPASEFNHAIQDDMTAFFEKRKAGASLHF